MAGAGDEIDWASASTSLDAATVLAATLAPVKQEPRWESDDDQYEAAAAAQMRPAGAGAADDDIIQWEHARDLPENDDALPPEPDFVLSLGKKKESKGAFLRAMRACSSAARGRLALTAIHDRGAFDQPTSGSDSPWRT